MTAFFKVSLPKSWKSTSPKKRKALGLSKNSPWPVNLQKINEAYHQAIRYLLKKNASINAGTAGQSIYNVRYLSHDPEAYLNTSQPAFTLSALLEVLKETEKTKQLQTFAAVASTITTSDAFTFAEAYAEAKGYEYQQGQKHLYFVRIAIACNLLGVPRENVEAYAEAKGGRRLETNAISHAYRKYKDSFGRWKHYLNPKQNQQLFEGAKDQKISTILTAEDALGKLVVAPTGSGKTFFVSTIPGRKIIVCPTVALVKNVAKEYKAVPFWGGERDTDSTLAANFIATTYSSFTALAELLSSQRETIKVFIDESHAFTSSTSANYQLRELTNILREAQNFESVTLLTGTELYNHHPFIRNMERVEVRLPSALKTFDFTDAADVLKATSDKIRISVAAGRFPLVLFNNKSEDGRLGTLKTLLKDVEGLRFFNSDTKDENEFLQIVRDGEIAEGIKGLITTSVLKEGNNIYNPYDFDVVVVGTFHASEVQQFSSRPRCPKSNHVSIIRSNRRKISPATLDVVKTACWIEDSAKAICNELNTQDGLTQNQYHQEFKARQAINGNPIFLNVTTSRYQVDYLLLSNQVFRMETTAQNRNKGLMIEALKSYGMKYGGATSSEAVQSKEEKKTAQTSRAAAKQKRTEAYLDVLKELAIVDKPLAEATAALTGRAHTLTPAQKDVYSRFERLMEVCTHQTAALAYMKDIGTKKATFELLLKRLRIEALRRDKVYMKRNRKFAIVLKAIHSKFKPGDKLTSSQIASKIGDVLKLDKSLDLSNMELENRSDRYLNVAKLFFELNRKDEKDDKGKRLNKYEICPLTFGVLLKEEPKVRGQNQLSFATSDLIPV